MNRISKVIITLIFLTIAGFAFVFIYNSETASEGSALKRIPYQIKKISNEPPIDKGIKQENDPEVEMVMGIPIGKKVELSLEQRVQETNYYCVPACVQMVLRYHGIDLSQVALASEMNTSSITGTEYVDMAKALNHHLFNKGLAADNEAGYHVQTVAINDRSSETKTIFEERVITDIDYGDPLFVTVNTNTLYPQLPPANHMIVITGYALHKDFNEIAFYYVIDPYTKVQDATHGGYKVFTSEEIMNALITNEEPAYLW